MNHSLPLLGLGLLCACVIPAWPSGSITKTAGAQPVHLTSGSEFIWPVSGWIASTHAYDPHGQYLHGGSADISAPLWTPILASRGGTVIASQGGGGVSPTTVTIDHGNGMVSTYGHNVQKVVNTGDTVRAGQLIGYVGSTHAIMAHVHFGILKDGARQEIPGLQFGAWVAQGEFVPGSWGLGSIAKPSFTFDVVSIVSALALRTGPSLDSSVGATVGQGTMLTVTGAAGGSGFYEVWYNNAHFWVVRSGVRPAALPIFWVKTTQTAEVADAPGAGAIIGSIAFGRPAGVFASQNGWYYVQFEKCGRSTDYSEFGWIAASSTTMAVDIFQTNTVRVDLPVRSGPGAGYSVVGTVSGSSWPSDITFYENQNGWYRILFNNGPGWIEGWKTGDVHAAFEASTDVCPETGPAARPNHISATATDASATSPTDPGRFLISRRADNVLLTQRVWYTLGGTAVRGIDYDLASTFWSPFSDSGSNSVVIPPGQDSLAAELYVIPKAIPTTSKTVVLTIIGSSEYHTELPTSAMITIGPTTASSPPTAPRSRVVQ